MLCCLLCHLPDYPDLPPPRPPPAQDCSIDVLLMTDPSPDCSEPLTETPNYKYGQLQMRMFYQSTDTIRSVLPSDDYSRQVTEQPHWVAAEQLPSCAGSYLLLPSWAGAAFERVVSGKPSCGAASEGVAAGDAGLLSLLCPAAAPTWPALKTTAAP